MGIRKGFTEEATFRVFRMSRSLGKNVDELGGEGDEEDHM